MCETGRTRGCYPEIDTTRNKYGTGLICMLRFETADNFIQNCLIFKGYKGFGFSDLRVLHNETNLKRGKVMRILLNLKSIF